MSRQILHAHGIKLGHKPAYTLRFKLCRVKYKREIMGRNVRVKKTLNVKISRLDIYRGNRKGIEEKDC